MIPRTFHRIWLGGEEPEWTKDFAATWLERHPGWELREWGDADLAGLFPLQNQDIFDRAEEVAPDHVGQLRSDVLRYELLYRFGGVYIDADFECLRSIGSHIEGCFAAWELQWRWIANGLMGATPGHPAIKALIDGLPRNVRRRAGSRPTRLSGPQYLSRVWRARKDVTVLDQGLVYPFGYREIEDFTPGAFDPMERWPDALAVHWWANKRREATTCLAR